MDNRKFRFIVRSIQFAVFCIYFIISMYYIMSYCENLFMLLFSIGCGGLFFGTYIDGYTERLLIFMGRHKDRRDG